MKEFYAKTQPLQTFYQKSKRYVEIDSPTSDIGYVKIKEIMDGLVKKKKNMA